MQYQPGGGDSTGPNYNPYTPVDQNGGGGAYSPENIYGQTNPSGQGQNNNQNSPYGGIQPKRHTRRSPLTIPFVIIAIVILIIVAYRFIPSHPISVSNALPPATNPVISSVYHKSNIELFSVLGTSINRTDSLQDVNVTYSGKFSEDYSYSNKTFNVSVPFTLIYEKLDSNSKLYVRTSGNSEYGDIGLMMIKLNSSNYSCFEFLSNKYSCEKTSNTIGPSDLNSVSPNSNSSVFESILKLSGTRNSTYTGQKCYYLYGSGNVPLDSGSTKVNYTSGSCLPFYNSSLPLNLTLNYDILNQSEDSNTKVSFSINEVAYNSKPSYSFISGFPANVTSPSKVVVNSTPPRKNSTGIHIYNCSNLTITTSITSANITRECTFDGGFMNFTYGGGNSGYAELNVSSLNGYLYYSGYTTNTCPRYVRSVFMPEGLHYYLINFFTGNESGNCGNATLYIN
ncbi:hypothetical protein [Candidatus Mancarchaeum acidiphilum]|nr:hypothetical protein [Candidatus Mancarchaeum acidiphilum]